MCHCTSERRKGKGAKHGGASEVRKNFLILLWHERSGKKVRWGDFNESSRAYQRLGGAVVPMEEDGGPTTAADGVPSSAVDGVQLTPADGLPLAYEHGECSTLPPLQETNEHARHEMMEGQEMAGLIERIRVLSEAVRVAEARAEASEERESISQTRLADMTTQLNIEKEAKEAAFRRYRVWLKAFGQEIWHERRHPARYWLPDDLHLEEQTVAVMSNSVGMFEDMEIPYGWEQITLPEHAREGHNEVCVVCQQSLGYAPTLNTGICRCKIHVNCFFDYLWISKQCPHCKRELTAEHLMYFGGRSARQDDLIDMVEEEREANETRATVDHFRHVEEALIRLVTKWRSSGGISAFRKKSLDGGVVQNLTNLRVELMSEARSLRDPRPLEQHSEMHMNASIGRGLSFGAEVEEILASLTNPELDDPMGFRVVYPRVDPNTDVDEVIEEDSDIEH